MADENKDGPQRPRIAVIGAGMSGLCALRHFGSDRRYDVTAFEQRDRVGGLWSYPDGCEDFVDADETSPQYCRIYRNLHLNGPSNFQSYPEFPFLDEETQAGIFPHRQVMTDYLHRYTKAHDLTSYIKFRRLVTRIEPMTEGGTSSPLSHIGPRWEFQVRHLDKPDHAETTEIFDAVLICNGHFNEPYTPKVESIKNFEGQVMHSAAYRVPETFRGKNVLLIGAASSANDLTCELMHYAKTVLISRRGKFANVFSGQGRFPNVHLVVPPLCFTAHHVSSLSSDIPGANSELHLKNSEGVDVRDVQSYPVDVVIFCTGYTDHMPFLTPECKLDVSRGKVSPLYKHLIHCEYPTLACVGVPRLTAPPKLIEDQVRYYKAVLDGKVKLPDRQTMMQELEEDERQRRSDGLQEHQRHLMYPLQKRYFPYLRGLANDAGFERSTQAEEKIMVHVIGKVCNEPYDFRKNRYIVVNDEEFVCEPI